MALSGWPLGLLFRVSAPEVLKDQRVVNDAAYLVEQSGPLLGSSRRGPSAALRGVPGAGACSPVAARAAAGDARHAAVRRRRRRRRRPTACPPPWCARCGALARGFPPGRRRAAAARAAATRRRRWSSPGRRVTYERFTPYLTQFASKADLEARHATVFRFFRTRAATRRSTIARPLGATYLALYGSDRVRFDTTGVLEAVYEEADARVYRIVGAERDRYEPPRAWGAKPASSSTPTTAWPLATSTIPIGPEPAGNGRRTQTDVSPTETRTELTGG